MKFNPAPIIESLRRNKVIIISSLQGIEKSEYLYRESSDKWSLLEALCHLLDEEKEDFRVRIKSVFVDPEKKLPPIDPVGWVKARKYQEQDYEEKIEEWAKERQKSLEWLEGLDNVPWHNAFQHHKFGPMSAKLFLCNWLSHDYHHIKQIVTIRRAYIMHTTGESLLYAGKW